MFPRNVFFEWNKQCETAVKYWQAGSVPSMEQGKERKIRKCDTKTFISQNLVCSVSKIQTISEWKRLKINHRRLPCTELNNMFIPRADALTSQIRFQKGFLLHLKHFVIGRFFWQIFNNDWTFFETVNNETESQSL